MTMPMGRVWSVRMEPATAFGRQPSVSPAASVRVRASGLTDGWSFRTRDTVATDTPASAATSLMLAIAAHLLVDSVDSVDSLDSLDSLDSFMESITRGIGIDYTGVNQDVGVAETGS